MYKKLKLRNSISLLLSFGFVGSSLLFLTSCTTQTNSDGSDVVKPNPEKPIPPQTTDPNPEIIPPIEDSKPTTPITKFEKIVGNGMVRTRYSTSSYIKSRYKRTPALAYTNDELKALWNEDKFEINDFPYPNNPNGLSFNKNRYKEIIDKYGSWFAETNDTIEPMMNPLKLLEMINKNEIKKHPIADYQYEINNRVTDDTLAVEKVFNIDMNEKGYISTGLFLPPGEMIEISIDNISDEEMASNNYLLYISLGRNEVSNVGYNHLNNSVYPKLWPYRMPTLQAKTLIRSKTFKFGSPFGGIVHLNNETDISNISKKNLKITIKNAVEAINYKHGETTKEEWNDQIKRYKNENSNNKITAPIFDISSDNIKFYGPVSKLKLEEYDLSNSTSQESYPQKVMDWWDYHAINSYDVIRESKKTKIPVMITFSNFVPVGLAVALRDLNSSVLPLSPISSLLDYNKLIYSDDSWITLHEFNHHNQSTKWAFKGGGESSNNVLSLLSLLENSNFYSDRSDLKQENNVSNGHLFKLVSRNQIKQTIKLGEMWNDITKSRDGSDTDFSIIFSQLGPNVFRKYVKSFFDERYATDYLGNKFEIPSKFLENESTQNAKVIYLISIISGYDWSEYSAFTKLLTENEKNIVKNELRNKYSNIKKMMPVGSFYASKIKYGNSKEWNKSSTPFYLNDIEQKNGYLFKKDLLVSAPIKENQETFAEISNFKITENPKFGLLTKENDDYKYKVNYNNDLSINNTDSFSYSFDVKDKSNNLNKVEFKVEIKLTKYDGFELSKNEMRIEDNVVGPYSTKLGINGEWEKGPNVGKFNKETLKSKNKNSELGFNFIGDSFDVYGFANNAYGEYNVYVDGKIITNTKNAIDINSKDMQKLSSHKLEQNKMHNVIVKPRSDKPIEISHFEFNGKLIDIKTKK